MNNNNDIIDIARYRLLKEDKVYHQHPNFDQSKYKHHTSLQVFFHIWYELWKGHKSKEFRSIDYAKAFNFAKKCNTSPGKCLLSLQAGYEKKEIKCELTFIVKDCYCLVDVNEKQSNGFVVKSSVPVVVFELGECVEVCVDKGTLNRIERKYEIDRCKLFEL